MLWSNPKNNKERENGSGKNCIRTKDIQTERMMDKQ
jgi:hypothetical protein